MKKIILNTDNLNIDDVQDIKYKVRTIIFNSNKELLVTNNGGVYLLPGGSKNNLEDDITAIKREVIEEVGIEIDETKLTPFLSYEEYVKNFPKRDGITFVSRYTKTIYFFYSSISCTDISKTNLSEKEKGNFYFKWVPIGEIETMLSSDYQPNNLKRIFFDKELLTVIKMFSILF